MPMPAKGARLHLRKRAGRPPVYVIKDGEFERSTGTSDRGAAEAQLAEHIRGKRRTGGPAAAADLNLGDVLAFYLEDHAPSVKAPERLLYAADALLPFWGNLPVSAVKKETCRRYVKARGRSEGTLRRELNVLQAAVNHAVREGLLLTGATVTLPEKPEPKQRALTRSEVARLVHTARRRGQHHLARFILVALYTGTRKAAILSLRLSGPSTVGGWFDLDQGVLHRRGHGERDSKKRRSAVRLPRQLLGHARRWHRMGLTWAVEWRGARTADIQTAFDRNVREAGLDWRPTPHTLKHTAITWAIQAGASVEDAASFFGTSPQTIISVYWDQSPRWQAEAVSAVERMGRRK